MFNTPADKAKTKLQMLMEKARADVAAKQARDAELNKDKDSGKQVADAKLEILKQAQQIIEESKSEPDTVEWHKEQLRAFELAKSGESFCLIGKAGTGKTTAAKQVIRILQQSGIVGPLRDSTKYLIAGMPGIAVVSFTNRAVKNIARGMPEDVARHTITVHKLLEFKPVFEDIPDPERPGEFKKIRRFLPSRHALNPLPSSLRLIIIEESSMIAVDLWEQLMDAIPHECQFIFLGDLQQLPPVYGSAILGFKLNQLPVIELTRIYRQAAGSPIIDLAWRISRGEKISVKDYQIITEASNGKLTLRPWKKRLAADDALDIMNRLFKQFVDEGVYNPNEDMIMIPFNKSLGTIEFNKNLAQHLGKKRNAKVHEIIAGFEKHYYAIGDKVLCDRQEAIVEDIIINDGFKGRLPLPASEKLNRWGMYEMEAGEKLEDKHATLDEVEELLLRSQAMEGEDTEAKQQASHILVCRILDDDTIMEVRTRGEYSATDFAYALTVHKCQGSEWRKCFLILHHSHATMISRELVYTAVTRAREELLVILEPDSLEKAAKNQRIKGDTIKEKAEYFKGKMKETMQ